MATTADDIQTRVDQAGNTALTDIDTYLIGTATSDLVKVAATAQGGNQSAAQIAAGAYGGAVAQAAPNATPAQINNAAQASMIAAGVVTSPWLYAGLAAVAAYLLLGRKSRA